MLKGIPKVLSLELLKVLVEMEHGDTIVIGDGNFPLASMGRGCVEIRCDGHGAVIVLAVVIDQAQRELQARIALQARSEEK